MQADRREDGDRPPNVWRARSTLLFALKALLAAGLLWWLTYSGQLHFGAYSALLEDLPIAHLLAIAGLVAVASLLYVARWRAVARAVDLSLSRREVLVTGLRGLFANLFLPGGVGPDGLRLWHLQQQRKDQLLEGIASLLMDRFIGLVALGTAGCIGTVFAARHVRFELIAVIGLANLAILVVPFIVGGLAMYAGRLDRYLPTRIALAARKLRDTLSLYSTRIHRLLWPLFSAMLGHVATALAFFVGIDALHGGNLALSAVVATTSLLSIINMIPLTPMGLGVTDLAAEHLFALHGGAMGAETQMLVRIVGTLAIMTSVVALFMPVRKAAPALAIHSESAATRDSPGG